ncbi:MULTISPECIES: hypothetical protein [Actinomycetes]|uniref:hypothetical protein n=1 Tax=Actinomycetes TaxID=1760 RepID=UPI000AB962AF|nr:MULTISPECIES: hypothetical protein [Actinomycetes]
MPKTTHQHDVDVTTPSAPDDGAPNRDATDDEFRRAYQQEKPRWAGLAERLK